MIPDDVVAITTVKGQAAIAENLLTPSPAFAGQTVWQALRKDLLRDRVANDDRLTLRIVVMERPDPATRLTRPVSDIRDPDDNLAAAEFILRQVRAHTDSKDRRLVASLVGGRKITMACPACSSTAGRWSPRSNRVTPEARQNFSPYAVPVHNW